MIRDYYKAGIANPTYIVTPTMNRYRGTITRYAPNIIGNDDNWFTTNEVRMAVGVCSLGPLRPAIAGELLAAQYPIVTNRAAIAILQDLLHAPGVWVPGYSNAASAVISRQLANGDVAVGLWNFSTNAAQLISIPLASIPGVHTNAVFVQDVFDGAISSTVDTLAATVNTDGFNLYRLSILSYPSAAGLTNFNATNLVGTIPDARLSTNVALLNGTNLFTGTNTFSGVLIATNLTNQIGGAFLNLPVTTASAGIIYSMGSPLLHAYGTGNLFVGSNAGNFTMSGSANTANGANALGFNTSGYNNTANGDAALVSNSSGYDNTANGHQALFQETSGAYNIALGFQAGYNITAGSSNIDIGNLGVSTDTNIIRIGSGQTQTFVAGIFNATASAAQVYVNSSGQLGINPSSAKFKQDVQEMDDTSTVLYALKPVTFRYRPEVDPQGVPQFGLAAEDVDKMAPDLVVRDEQHGIYSVRYQAVDAMLLNEFLKQHRKVEEQNAEIEALKQKAAKVDSLERRLNALEQTLQSPTGKK